MIQRLCSSLAALYPYRDAIKYEGSPTQRLYGLILTMSPTKPIIALVGSHSEDVLAALQNASLKSTAHNSTTAVSTTRVDETLLTQLDGEHVTRPN